MKFRAAIILFLFAFWPSMPAVAGSSLADAQVKELIIQQSIDSYPGTCPCPYSRARNGSRCGGRSAYSRPGGYAPICYTSDITKEMIAKYRHEH